MGAFSLTPLVRSEFGPLAEAHAFREVRAEEANLYHLITYASETRIVQFGWERRDCFVDVRYGHRRLLLELNGEPWLDYDNTHSLLKEMLDSGIDVPHGCRLYQDDNFAKTVRILIEGIKQRPTPVLGADEWE